MKLPYVFLIVVAMCFQSMHLRSQQPSSPLASSFSEYQELKKSTPYRFQWESLGPVLNSARVEAVQVDASEPGTMYAAFGSGNLWKTVDNGLKWKPIFEDQPVLGIGDIALAPSNSEVIYLGTGESLKKSRNFTMPGNGVYRSTDGGETWKHCGLDDSWHIGEIAVHSTDPDIAIVAVMGHFWSTNEQRGVYRTVDGGKTWEHVLYVDEKTGANDVVISPSDPKIMYASMWENNPGVSGSNSAIYVSTDGGATWKKSVKGFPQGAEIGRIGLAVSHTDPLKAYALVDNRGKKASAEVYRTLDGGKNWKRTHEDDLLINSVLWYFSDIYVNPQNDEDIYGLGVRMAHSSNGGKDFELVGGDVYHLFPSDADRLHLDHCELWIDPLNPDHMAVGNDGGLYVTYDKGGSWLHHNNIPAGEFYDIAIDTQDPYLIYGGTQDDASVYGPSVEWNPNYADGWKYLWVDAWSGGDGCVTQIDPDDPNTVYFSSQNGAVRRKDMKSGRSKGIKPKLPANHKGTLQYNFVAPYMISNFDGKTLYHAGNYIFKSINRGEDWTVISKDLGKASDPDKKSVAAGAFAESPIHPGHLYVGTDKGAFWITTDDGATWTERSKGLPNAYIRSIVPSKYNGSRIYITLTGLNYDDLSNHIYVSGDNGKNWKKMQGNLPNEPAHVIYEDPVYENILYAGMYRGVYVSVDRGGTWSLLGDSMPAVAVADIEMERKSKDMIVATHGRGIYKINLGPLHEMMASGFPLRKNTLFTIPMIKRPYVNDTHRDMDYNTAYKVPLTFWSTQEQEAILKVFDEKDTLLWSTRMHAQEGINQLRWNLIVEQQSSDSPYFIHYDKFIEKGSYRVVLEIQDDTLEGHLIVEEGKW